MQTTDLGHGRGWLTPDPAASIHRIDAALGRPVQITSAGRTWDEQNADYQRYLRGQGAYALHPDTPSVHQRGAAVDSNESITLGTLWDAHGWMLTALHHGEWWHREYDRDRDQHLNDDPTTPNQPEEDPMILCQLDPAVDGRWVIINVRDGVYWQVRNGLQLDTLRGTPGVHVLGGPQPVSMIEGLIRAVAPA